MKTKTTFVCQQCGVEFPRWSGRCPDCGEWGSLVEEKVTPPGGGVTARPGLANRSHPTPVTELVADEAVRKSTGIDELDRALGGGLVPGAAVLIGGEPGIGKSTLMFQMCAGLAMRDERVLYVSAEESAPQIRMRAARLGMLHENIVVFTETEVDLILDQCAALDPALLVVDSIQTVHDPSVLSSPGSVAQVRESANRLVYHAKRSGVPACIVGHITKQGTLAGPKVMEHLVDTVLYFEGDTFGSFRILRAVKNRFGPTNELGIFQMTDAGLEPVANPSQVFLSGDGQHAGGTAAVPVLEGTRTLIVEVQALVARANYGQPARKVTGLDPSRVAMILAVLEKRCGILLADKDVFANVAGGVRVTEPAGDLAVALAVASSLRDQPLEEPTIALGEIALSGRLRPVARMEERLKEAAKLGFKTAIVPDRAQLKEIPSNGLRLRPVSTVEQALEATL